MSLCKLSYPRKVMETCASHRMRDSEGHAALPDFLQARQHSCECGRGTSKFIVNLFRPVHTDSYKIEQLEGINSPTLKHCPVGHADRRQAGITGVIEDFFEPGVKQGLAPGEADDSVTLALRFEQQGTNNFSLK